MKSGLWRSLGALLFALPATCAAVRGQVTFVDLGLPGGATESFATAINDHGVIAIRTNTQPWLRTPGGDYIPAGLPQGFAWGEIVALNNAGVGVGSVAASPTGEGRAFIRSAGGTYLLPIPQQRSYASGITEAGEVTLGTINPHTAQLYRPSSGVSVLPLPAGTSLPTTAGINNNGLIIGTGGPTSNPGVRGYKYSPSIGFVPLTTNPYEASEAVAVNDAGVIVGWMGGLGFPVRPVKWLPDNSFVELPVLPGYGLMAATGINERGDIIGTGFMAGGRALLWSDDFGNIDLNDLLTPDLRTHWTLFHVDGINEQRQIVGAGKFDPDGPGGPLPAHNRAFLLNLPEPGMGAATLGLLILVRRRRG